MTNFILEQAWVTSYTDSRTCTCVQVPDKYPIVNVRVPYTMMNQTKPLVGSLVMIASMDNHKHYVIAVLREPSPTFNQDPNQLLNSNDLFTGNTLAPGEVFLQAAGTPNVTTGLGASLYIGNNGSLTLSSSTATEKIIVGGTNTDDMDHEIVIQAPNVFIESPLSSIGGIQSTLNFDDLNYISLSNNIVTPATSLTVPISELTMSPLGDIVLRNTTAGVTKGFLAIDSASNVLLGNTLSSLYCDPVGNISITGTTINLNNGIEGVARVLDITTSNISLDPTYWTMINALQTFFTALSGFTGGSPVVHSELGVLGLAFLAQVPLVPSSLTSQISSGSLTVKVG